jgi:hypothetical protein
MVLPCGPDVTTTCIKNSDGDYIGALTVARNLRTAQLRNFLSFGPSTDTNDFFGMSFF